MCGIAGFVDFNKKEDRVSLNRMISTLAHRGPDGEDTVLKMEDDYQIGLGHRRLSIIDLSPSGKQPMQKHGLTITYNGEIYNYKNIKDELIGLGYVFHSTSDTEVMLSAFDCWGIEATVTRLIGMFAIVLYDENKRKVYFIRDRAGVKPFYYYENEGCILFGSELKALKESSSFTASLNLDAVHEYFTKGYISAPRTIFQHCKKLEQGHILTINLDNQRVEKKEYWNVSNFLGQTISISNEEAILETEAIISKASQYRMVADTPVGIFLSGGIDSTLVTTLLQKESTQKLRTFTIGFEDSAYDESEAARDIANYLGTEHTELICTIEEAKKVIPLIPMICDEPFGDSSIIPTYLVSKMAAKEVKVALSSDGGDEQFIGYQRYVKAMKLAKYLSNTNRKINGVVGSLITNTLGSNPVYNKLGNILSKSEIGLIPYIQTICLSNQDANQLIKSHNLILKYPEVRSDDVNSIFAFEYQNYMHDDILVKVDRATMANSLEGREPLLDHHIAEWAMKLPVQQKYANNKLKYLLKEIIYKYVPSELVDRPKSGFSIPIFDWIRQDLNYLIKEYLDEGRIKRQDIFDFSFIIRKLQEFDNKNQQAEQFIWNMLVFQMWYDEWF